MKTYRVGMLTGEQYVVEADYYTDTEDSIIFFKYNSVVEETQSKTVFEMPHNVYQYIRLLENE